MKWLDIEETELASRGGLATAREIEQQPGCWRETHALLAARRAQVDAFLAPLLATPGLRIILTGAGTSAYIGQCLLPVLLERTRMRVEAIATTDLLSMPRAWLQPEVPTLLVSFARSGSSPESVAAIDIAERCVPGVHHLVITCNAAGALYRACATRERTLALVLPESTHDQGFAMTASFSAMLYAGLALLGGFDAAAAGLEAACRAGERTLHQHVQALRELAQRDHLRVVFLGSGPHTGLAQEAALKVMELSDGAVATFANSPLGFRHGPKAVVKRDTLVVMFVATADLARRYDLDLLRELAGDGAAGALLAVSNRPDPRLPGVLWLEVAAPGVGDDALLMLPYVAIAQAYAFHRSLALGRTPDSPSVSGTVSRVVRGVTVHGLP